MAQSLIQLVLAWRRSNYGESCMYVACDGSVGLKQSWDNGVQRRGEYFITRRTGHTHFQRRTSHIILILLAIVIMPVTVVSSPQTD
jgi:hypothetical protein